MIPLNNWNGCVTYYFNFEFIYFILDAAKLNGQMPIHERLFKGSLKKRRENSIQFICHLKSPLFFSFPSVSHSNTSILIGNAELLMKWMLTFPHRYFLPNHSWNELCLHFFTTIISFRGVTVITNPLVTWECMKRRASEIKYFIFKFSRIQASQIIHPG